MPSPSADPGAGTVVCVDFGSTFTKAGLVDLARGRIVAAASHPTTIGTDVLDGYDACLARLVEQDPRAADAAVLACSSAGGGLRIAVVGNEELVTAEAGRRVALSSGGRVVAVLSGGLGDAALSRLRAAEPDVLLLVGGTDGGNAEVLEADAGLLSRSGWSGPVVVAGNVESQDLIGARFRESRTPYVLADNVVPRIGVLAPDSARSAIREVFLAHVIGGSELSAGPRFATLVRGATPDVVLTAVELLGDHPARVGPDDRPDDRPEDRPEDPSGVVVVDVGGATTDVYSVVPLPEEPDGAGRPRGLSREVVAATPATRTVEGDLGLRWSAAGTVAAALAAGDLPAQAAREVRPLASGLGEEPGHVPANQAERDLDARLTGWAAGEALRRHARGGVDLRTVGLVVGSGGALRHAADPTGLLGSVLTEDRSWVLPAGARVAVDTDYVLAAAGLLADDHRAAALALLERFCPG